MSLTIDGKHISSLNLRMFADHDHPAVSQTRDYTVEIPGMNGAYDYGADLGPKPFNLPLEIQGCNTQAELALAIRNLLPTFIDLKGKPKTVKLIFDYEKDVFYLARYSGTLPIERIFRKGKFVLPMKAYDPNKHFVVSSEEITWGSETPFMSDVPLDAQYTFGIIGPQNLTVYNFGTLTVHPVIEITGSAQALTLTINGKSFSLGAFADTTIVIDSKEYVVLKEGSNFLSGLTGDLENLYLEPGGNIIGVAGSVLNIKITFKFHAQYL